MLPDPHVEAEEPVLFVAMEFPAEHGRRLGIGPCLDRDDRLAPDETQSAIRLRLVEEDLGLGEVDAVVEAIEAGEGDAERSLPIGALLAIQDRDEAVLERRFDR